MRRADGVLGRTVAATAALLAGVALVATTVETTTIWWAVGGFLLLAFVPALIVDACTATHPSGARRANRKEHHQ